MTASRARFTAFRRTQSPPPPLVRTDVAARGLTFATWRSPHVSGAMPLVCINGGLLFDHSLLWPALAPLSAVRQLIFYDQRGRGESQQPPGVAASRIEFDASDVVALRLALGIDEWDLLGHSWGGGIAMQACALDADAVRRLVLINAVGVTGEWLPTMHEAGIAHLLRAGHVESAAQLRAFDVAQLTSPDPAIHARYAQTFFPAWFADPGFVSRTVPPLGLSITGAHVAARLRRDGYDWTARVGALRCPTLVLHGAEDVLPLAVAQRTRALLARQGASAQLLPLPGAGHNPFWEAAAVLFAAIEAFLGADHSHSRAPPDG